MFHPVFPSLAIMLESSIHKNRPQCSLWSNEISLDLYDRSIDITHVFSSLYLDKVSLGVSLVDGLAGIHGMQGRDRKGISLSQIPLAMLMYLIYVPPNHPPLPFSKVPTLSIVLTLRFVSCETIAT